MDTTNYPWLLSRILDEVFCVSKEKANVTRKIVKIRDSLHGSEKYTSFTTGSASEGFNSFRSDLDLMEIFNDSIVMYDYKQEMTADVETNIVLLVKSDNCKPGYVNLQIASFGNVVDQEIVNSVVPIFDSLFLSSDIFREEEGGKLKRTGVKCLSTGPSNKIHSHVTMTVDDVTAFCCCDWPYDAYEWISRKRIFGWPSECMIDNIVNMGCHIVPVGDKCSEDTFLQWRISFAAAERYLAHTLNNIQFQVYGLLKYTLQQIKDRIEHDTGEDDILCSYFMKTLIFYAVENSPQSLWQEKNIFVCFRFCLTMLTDWVQCGYCPNYFIKTNNMFKRKVHGGNKIKVLNILYELYDMKWQALSVGSAYRPSILEHLQNPVLPVELLNHKTPTMKEYERDIGFLVNIVGIIGAEIGTVLPFRKAMAMIAKAHSETDELLSYCALVKLLVPSAKEQLSKHHEANSGNKFTYSSQKKGKHWMSLTYGSDKLYLATYYYHAGSYRKVIELCRRITSSITFWDGERYSDAFCGRGYSLNYKLNQAFVNVVQLHASLLYFCPSDLHMELLSLHPYPLFIPPKPYAMFLTFMCYHNTGDTKERDEELNDLLAIRYEVYQNKEFHWIVHTLTGICYQTKGDYSNALKAYQASLKSNTRGNPAMQRIEDLQVYMLALQRENGLTTDGTDQRKSIKARHNH